MDYLIKTNIYIGEQKMSHKIKVKGNMILFQHCKIN